jgi:hypothetical protein
LKLKYQLNICGRHLLTSAGRFKIGLWQLSSRLVRATAVVLCLLVPPLAEADERIFELSGFDGVTVSQGIHVLVTTGDKYKIIAESDDSRQLGRLEMNVRGATLRARLHTGLFSPFRTEDGRVTVLVTIPKLIRAETMSGASLVIETMTGADLELRSSGGSTLRVEVAEGGMTNARVSSGAKIDIANGTCRSLSAEVSGGSSLDMKMLKCVDVEIQASGGSRASVHADKNINADASSGASIRVYGAHEEVEINSRSGGAITFP